MCMIEKEVCLNTTIANSIANGIEKQNDVIVIEDLQQSQKIILGILLSMMGLSLCINMCWCISCMRRRKSKIIRKQPPQPVDKSTAEPADEIYVL